MDVNDNCPVLAQTVLTYVPIPALQVDPFVSLNATDADSTINAELLYYHSEVIET